MTRNQRFSQREHTIWPFASIIRTSRRQRLHRIPIKKGTLLYLFSDIILSGLFYYMRTYVKKLSRATLDVRECFFPECSNSARSVRLTSRSTAAADRQTRLGCWSRDSPTSLPLSPDLEVSQLHTPASSHTRHQASHRIFPQQRVLFPRSHTLDTRRAAKHQTNTSPTRKMAESQTAGGSEATAPQSGVETITLGAGELVGERLA